ncbi:hypothetical protein F6R98_20540 [Candidatus Methylospira mobilis]|uniref:DUF4019 domain-containing protein n=1 Tax=Candidatus Methylospira mobilis TaxID=1808979 RepID=A0A5Q0BLL0_9GAMM|nr:hypothetical protein [Candidatus Methylospira mobilis]QFY44723.1 hypothetical protein F6R98_20540 [Candidatus Methylospira mobilis]
MKVKIFIVILFVLLSVIACSGGQEDVDRIARVMQKNPPDEFESVMNLFIDYARKGDLDKMISMTSEVTIRQAGTAELNSAYTSAYKFLQSCISIDYGSDVYYIDNQASGTGSGWKFVKTCNTSEEKKEKFHITLLNENDRIVVTSTGPEPE